MSTTMPMQDKSKSPHSDWSAARPSICLSKPFGYRVIGAPGMHRPSFTNRANVQTWLLSLSGGWSG